MRESSRPRMSCNGCVGKAKSRTGNRFSRGKSKIPRRKSLFPCGKGKMPRRKSRFPCGKGEIPHWKLLSRAGKAKFHLGNPFSCVSAVANTITIAGSSCLGREFRLDEPQRKKDFRK